MLDVWMLDVSVFPPFSPAVEISHRLQDFRFLSCQNSQKYFCFMFSASWGLRQQRWQKCRIASYHCSQSTRSRGMSDNDELDLPLEDPPAPPTPPPASTPAKIAVAFTSGLEHTRFHEGLCHKFEVVKTQLSSGSVWILLACIRALFLQLVRTHKYNLALVKHTNEHHCQQAYCS